MSKETIQIVFDGKGGSEITVSGVKGTGCKDLTASLEEALGTVVSDEETPEMHEREVEVNEYRNRY